MPRSVEGRQTSAPSRRAVLVGQRWSADLAEAMTAMYGPLIDGGWTLEDLAQMLRETGDDGSGD